MSLSGGSSESPSNIQSYACAHINDSGSAKCASHYFFHNFAAARVAFRPRIMLAIRKDSLLVTCRTAFECYSTRGMCHRLQLASTSRTQERHSSSHLRFRDSSLFPSFLEMIGQAAPRLGDFMFFNVPTSECVHCSCASGSMGLRKRPIAGCPGPTPGSSSGSTSAGPAS